MFKKRLFTGFLSLVLVSALCSSFSYANATYIPMGLPAPYSIDSTFTLNFSESRLWVQDFDNSGFWTNHDNVRITYNSNTPNTVNGSVRIDLFIDDDADGVYDPYDESGGYTFTLNCGNVLQIALPYGKTIKKYRLVFANENQNVTSASFTVDTFAN